MSAPTAPARRTGVILNTTDATETVAVTFPTKIDTSYHVMARIVAVETVDHDEMAAYTIVGGFKNDGGTLTQVGSTAALVTIESTSAWAVAFGVSGTTIQIKVTGAALTVMTWRVDTYVLEVS